MSADTDAREALPVTQEDRETVRDIYLVEHMIGDEANAFIWGWRDGHPYTQIAARHRLNTLPAPPSIGGEAEWRDIASAPKDGTDILAWCVHPNAQYGDTIADRSDWQCAVVTRWIDFNGGGWTWHGMVGRFTHWLPLPASPEHTLTRPEPERAEGVEERAKLTRDALEGAEDFLRQYLDDLKADGLNATATAVARAIGKCTAALSQPSSRGEG